MPRQNPYSEAPITEIHEERIQRLEGSVQTLVVQGAESIIKMEHLAEKIEEGFQGINQKLDLGTEQFLAHATALGEHRADLNKLQEVEAARAARVSIVKKAALPLLAAAAGVLATKGGESIWLWLTSVFH